MFKGSLKSLTLFKHLFPRQNLKTLIQTISLMLGNNFLHKWMRNKRIMFTSVSSVGLDNIGKIRMASKETAPVWFVLSFLALIQRSSEENSPSFIKNSTSPLL